MRKVDRREFLQLGVAAGTGMALAGMTRRAAAGAIETTQVAPEGFFTLGQRNGHWWLISPDGTPFFTMGLNHIDPASLRYPENIHIWREKYGDSTVRWIKESVVPNLKAWGFNTVGWVQEVTVKQWRHSRPFTNDEYKALGMPYCHLLPFIESHQWEKHTVHFDFRSADWQEWCDYVARSHCAELSEDPNLIGYFYSDCPCWIHERPVNAWRGPMFNPERLKSEAGVNWRSKAFYRPNNGKWYAETLAALHKNPGCIGFHLCGAYQRNKARRRGLLDEMENPDTEQVDLMTEANRKISVWMEKEF